MIKKRALFVSCTFALLCSAANWQSVTTYAGDPPGPILTANGAHFIILVSVISIFWLIRSAYRSLRVCFDRGIRIPRQVRLINWMPCLLLLPVILFRWSTSDSVNNPGETPYIRHMGYGSDLSTYAALIAALAILSYQLAAGLRFYRDQASGSISTAVP